MLGVITTRSSRTVCKIVFCFVNTSTHNICVHNYNCSLFICSLTKFTTKTCYPMLHGTDWRGNGTSSPNIFAEAKLDVVDGAASVFTLAVIGARVSTLNFFT
jgi:hypothetical protein